MNKTSSYIQFAQVLHGYHDGHQLLAASEKIDSSTKTKLLQMSDSPGSGFNDSDNECLTGYPIQEAGRYALAKTWPANEMKRPGCVWTHTILIDFSDIPRIKDLSSISSCFRMPESLTFDSYKQSISLNNEGIINSISGNDALGLEQLIYLLYSTKTTVELPRSLVSDDIVFKVWSQQWPRLRRSFYFRTWSKKTNSKNKPMFDLVLSVDDNSIHNFNRPKTEDYNWLSDAAEDAVNNWGGNLRSFFWRHGGNTTQTREAYVPLLQAWKISEEDEKDYAKLSSYLLNWPSHPNSIVRAIAKKISHSQLSILGESTTDLLMSDLGVIKENDLSKSGEILLGRSVGKNNPELLPSIVTPWSEHSEGILKGVLETIPCEKIISYLEERPELTEKFILANIKILENPKIWKNEKIANIALREIDEQNADNVIPVIIDSDSTQYATYVVERFGGKAFKHILNRISKNNIEVWIQEAAKKPGEFLSMVAAHSSLSIDDLMILSLYISPFENAPICNSDPWVTAIHRSEFYSIPNKLAIYFTRRVLSGVSRQSYELLKISFSACYSLIDSYKLNWNEWDSIDSVLPHSNTWLPLSKKDKFIFGIAKHVVDEKYSASQLLGLTNNNRLLQKLISSIASSEDGLNYLQSLNCENLFRLMR